MAYSFHFIVEVLINWKSFTVGADLMEFSSEDTYRTRYIPKFRILFPVTLRKVEVHAETGAWRLASYIREGSQSGQISEHISALRLAKGSKDIISVEATHTIEGAFPENIIIKNEATGNSITSFL